MKKKNCSTRLTIPIPSDSPLLRELQVAESICFVGDSITEGTKNGLVGWYEPIAAAFPTKMITTFAKGSMTSKWFRDNREMIAEKNADLYVLAYGCNDIRYRDEKVCAMSEQEYVDNIDTLIGAIRNKNPNAHIVFIAPFESMNHDVICKASIKEKNQLYAKYSAALSAYCDKAGVYFLNPNPYIFEKLAKNVQGVYMVDYIHPGSALGCKLYSEACLWCR